MKSRLIEAISLAPVSVLPAHQRRGIGTLLVAEGLQICRDTGHDIILVLGEPQFYSRFGFSSKLAEPLYSRFGGGEAWMAIELAPGALTDVSGNVVWSEPFLKLC
jgi:putative acetyltransferase